MCTRDGGRRRGSLRCGTLPRSSFESLRSVASFLGAAESSSAWASDGRDDDSLYSRAPRAATPAWLKDASEPTFASVCVCVLLPNSLFLPLLSG